MIFICMLNNFLLKLFPKLVLYIEFNFLKQTRRINGYLPILLMGLSKKFGRRKPLHLGSLCIILKNFSIFLLDVNLLYAFKRFL